MSVKVGDEARVRSWKSLKNEFGGRSDHDYILCGGVTFEPEMRYLCGKILRIRTIGEFSIRCKSEYWLFSEEMFVGGEEQNE